MKLSFSKSEVKFFAEALKKEVIANTFYKLECVHIANILKVNNVIVLENFFKFLTEKKDDAVKGKISRAMKDMFSELKLATKDKAKQKKIKDKYQKKIKELKNKGKDSKKKDKEKEVAAAAKAKEAAAKAKAKK